MKIDHVHAPPRNLARSRHNAKHQSHNPHQMYQHPQPENGAKRSVPLQVSDNEGSEETDARVGNSDAGDTTQEEEQFLSLMPSRHQLKKREPGETREEANAASAADRNTRVTDRRRDRDATKAKGMLVKFFCGAWLSSLSSLFSWRTPAPG